MSSIPITDLTTSKSATIPSTSPLEVFNQATVNKGFIGRVIDTDPINGTVSIFTDSRVFTNVRVMQPITTGTGGFSLPKVLNYRDRFEKQIFAHILFIDGVPYVNNILPGSYTGVNNVPDSVKMSLADQYKQLYGKDFISRGTVSDNIANSISMKFGDYKTWKLPDRYLDAEVTEGLVEKFNGRKVIPNDYKSESRFNEIAKAVRESYYIGYGREELDSIYRSLKDPNSMLSKQLKKYGESSSDLLSTLVDYDSPTTHRQIAWMGDSILYRGDSGSKIVGMDDSGGVAMIGGTYCHSTWKPDQSLEEVVKKHKYRNSCGSYEWGPITKTDENTNSGRYSATLWSHVNNFYDATAKEIKGDPAESDDRRVFKFEFGSDIQDGNVEGAPSAAEKDLINPTLMMQLFKPKYQNSKLHKSFNDTFKSLKLPDVVETSEVGTNYFKAKITATGVLEISVLKDIIIKSETGDVKVVFLDKNGTRKSTLNASSLVTAGDLVESFDVPLIEPAWYYSASLLNGIWAAIRNLMNTLGFTMTASRTTHVTNILTNVWIAIKGVFYDIPRQMITNVKNYWHV